MGKFLLFYWRCCAVALTGTESRTRSWFWIGTVIAAPLLGWLVGREMQMAPLETAFAVLGVFGVIFACRLVLAPFWIHGESQAEIERLTVKKLARETRDSLGLLLSEGNGILQHAPISEDEVHSWMSEYNEWADKALREITAHVSVADAHLFHVVTQTWLPAPSSRSCEGWAIALTHQLGNLKALIDRLA
jgi:hypothetical protein